ncbi:YidH family protein [Candidatus Dependentiae bacterium]
MKNDNLEKELEKFESHEAAEQTLLAWIQTGLTMTGFGFGIGSLIAFMNEQHYEKGVVKAIRVIGELLIFVGFVSIILALIQHRIKVRRLRNKDFKFKSSFSLSLFVGILISLLGIAAFVAILVHIIF